MKTELRTLAAGVSLSALLATGASAATIDFEDAAAPCTFAQTSALTNRYASQGITFSGGGSILNQCGSFGINARSGVNFLGFNSQVASTVELAFFDSPQTSFSLYNGSGSSNTVTLRAFDSNGGLVGISTSTNVAGQYSLLSFSSATGFSSIRLDNSAASFVYDDLGFGNVLGAVPEPSTWAMLIIGFGAVGAALRTQRAKQARIAYA